MEDKNKLELSVMLNEFGSIGPGEFIQFAKKNFFFTKVSWCLASFGDCRELDKFQKTEDW